MTGGKHPRVRVGGGRIRTGTRVRVRVRVGMGTSSWFGRTGQKRREGNECMGMGMGAGERRQTTTARRGWDGMGRSG